MNLFACWRTVCRGRSEDSFMSKLEHSAAPHCKWVLMSFPAFIFCTVRQPYGSTEMSAAPAGANILQPPWWHCHQSFTYSQVIACSRHVWLCVCVYIYKPSEYVSLYTCTDTYSDGIYIYTHTHGGVLWEHMSFSYVFILGTVMSFFNLFYWQCIFKHHMLFYCNPQNTLTC